MGEGDELMTDKSKGVCQALPNYAEVYYQMFSCRDRIPDYGGVLGTAGEPWYARLLADAIYIVPGQDIVGYPSCHN